MNNKPEKQNYKEIMETVQSKPFMKQVSLALPKTSMDASRLIRTFLTELKQKPLLRECTIQSLGGALIQCAQLGLEPGGFLQHMHLIPFKNNQKNRYECQIILGYRGMIDLAYRSKIIRSISARVVREGDDFEFEFGSNEHFRHVMKNNSGEITYAYCKVEFVEGGYTFNVLTPDEIEKRRRFSKAASSQYSPWVTWPSEMAAKTAIRAIFKTIPISIELCTALAIDDAADAGKTPYIDLDTGEFHDMSSVSAASVEFFGEDDEIIKEMNDESKKTKTDKLMENL